MKVKAACSGLLFSAATRAIAETFFR